MMDLRENIFASLHRKHSLPCTDQQPAESLASMRDAFASSHETTSWVVCSSVLTADIIGVARTLTPALSAIRHVLFLASHRLPQVEPASRAIITELCSRQTPRRKFT